MAAPNASFMDEDDRQSVASAATTVFHGNDDAATNELRAMRKEITAARKALADRFGELVQYNVPPEDIIDDVQDFDAARFQYGESIIAFVARAHELLSPLTRANRVRLAQVASAVERARKT